MGKSKAQGAVGAPRCMVASCYGFAYIQAGGRVISDENQSYVHQALNQQRAHRRSIRTLNL